MTNGISRRHVCLPPLSDEMLSKAVVVVMLSLKRRGGEITFHVVNARVTVTLTR